MVGLTVQKVLKWRGKRLQREEIRNIIRALNPPKIPRTKTFHAMPAMPRTGDYSAVIKQGLPSGVGRGGEGWGGGRVNQSSI